MSQGRLKVKGRRSEKKAIKRAWNRLRQVARRLDREEGHMTTRERRRGGCGGLGPASPPLACSRWEP